MKEWLDKIQNATSLDVLENLRVETLGKKGFLTLEFAKLKDIPNEQKKEFAQNLNEQKTAITSAIDAQKEQLEKVALNAQLETERIDVTMFNNDSSVGAVHPVMRTMDAIITYFQN